eukprot:scaffold26793_cov73-Isochrysis_galbana.AAC.1
MGGIGGAGQGRGRSRTYGASQKACARTGWGRHSRGTPSGLWLRLRQRRPASLAGGEARRSCAPGRASSSC